MDYLLLLLIQLYFLDKKLVKPILMLKYLRLALVIFIRIIMITDFAQATLLLEMPTLVMKIRLVNISDMKLVKMFHISRLKVLTIWAKNFVKMLFIPMPKVQLLPIQVRFEEFSFIVLTICKVLDLNLLV